MWDAPPPLPPTLPLIPTATADGAVLAAYSGGLDSTVLLHRLATDPAIRARGLRAVHVHHGLHADADGWALHCAEVCAALDVAFDVQRVTVPRDSGLGLEAAAREARRAAFAAAMRPGDCIALAQHRDDQAETFLLHALRGSGPDGLAAMRPWRRFGDGWLWRPLLETPRSALLAYAEAHGLRWIEDPSNADLAFDRNFLRHRVLPLLRARWPQADAGFARAATLAAESADLLAGHDRAALADVRTDTGALSVPALRALAPPARARMLRLWATTLGWPPLSAAALARIDAHLLDATIPPDRQPAVDWHGRSVRRWRDALHAVDPAQALPVGWQADWDGRAPLVLPNGDRLALVGANALPAPCRVHARIGGERLRLPGRTHHHALKHLLQDAGLPLWERARLPLLGTVDGTLLAAGDRFLDAGFAHWLAERGAHLAWTRA
ncbi:MAG: tRNA lysidine(34) synthetase TilS [Lysobacteraceae bacterium]